MGGENFPKKRNFRPTKLLQNMDVQDADVRARFAALADPTLPVKSLFALKQIAGALESGFLTLIEARRAATYFSPDCAAIFNDAVYARGMISAIEMILQERYPARFRADVPR